MKKTRAALAALAMLAVLLLPAPPADAATVNWSDNYPATGTVTIPAGEVVILDRDVDLAGLVVNGALYCGPQDAELRTRYMVVNGALRCGNATNRHQADFTITLTGSGNGNVQGFGDKYLVARPGSTVRLYGEVKTPWVRLTQTASAGATTLQLEDNNWEVGDRIAIAPTDFNQYQAEDALIVARSGNTVTIDRPLNYMHYCDTETFGSKSITECAEVGLLSRNITIRGDDASEQSQIGGHSMFHQGSSIRVDGVEFWRMGQVGRSGRYPVHFHLFGDASSSDFRNSSIWRSYNRWITVHGTQNLRLKNNVAYDGIGHGYYFEDGDEIGNKLVGNLGILTREAEGGQAVTPSDTDPAAFWIANPDNTLINNVAAGAGHSGFWYSLPERPIGDSTANLWPRQTPLGVFHGNVAHSVGFAGLMIDRGERPDRQLETVWYNPVQVPGNPDSGLVQPVFRNFTAYKSRHYGMWVRTFSGAHFMRMTFADNWRGVYLANIRAGGDRTNIGTISDSLIVGETSNVGQPEPWETTGVGGRSLPKFWAPDAALGGVPFYDGPMIVRSTVFANFQGNGQRDAGALTNLFPNEFWVSPANYVLGATFVNAQRVLLPDVQEFMDGDATAVFIDWDGSVTGTAGSSVTVQDALVDTSACTAQAQWNAMICGPEIGFSSITISRQDGGTAHIEVSRSDGRSFGFDGANAPTNVVSITVVGDMEHRLSWQNGTPTSFNMYVPNTARMRGQAARLILPAPSGSWEFQVNGQYDSAPNLAALNSGPSNWYYDAAANEIHLRLVGSSNWVTLR